MSNILRTISRSVARFEGTTVHRAPRNTVGNLKGPSLTRSLLLTWRGRGKPAATAQTAPAVALEQPKATILARAASAVRRVFHALRGR